MFDRQPQTQVNDWWQANTSPAPVRQIDSTDPTAMGQAAAPEYAWSAEPVMPTADDAAATPRRRLLHPVAAIAAGGGVIAAVAAGLVVVLGGHSTPSPTAASHPATTAVNTQAAAAPTQPTPTQPAPTRSVPAPMNPTLVTHRQASRTVTPPPATQTYLPTPPTTDNSEWNEQHTQQWQPPRYDTDDSDTDNSRPSWHWNFFRSHDNDSEHRTRSFDGDDHNSTGRHGGQSSEHQSSNGDN